MVAVRAQRESQIRFSGTARTVDMATSDESSNTVRRWLAASDLRSSHWPLTTPGEGRLLGGIVRTASFKSVHSLRRPGTSRGGNPIGGANWPTVLFTTARSWSTLSGL